MPYTRRKIRAINFSFLMAAVIFAGWALVCAWLGWPRSFPHGGATAFTLFVLAALFFASFPVIWARFPAKHPVYHALLRYGRLGAISAQLDREMSGPVESLGPFRFTASFLVYDPSYEFQLIPYHEIAAAEVISDEGNAGIVVRTRKGRSYQWYSTWMQGRFDPQKVVEQVRSHIVQEKPQAG